MSTVVFRKVCLQNIDFSVNFF